MQDPPEEQGESDEPENPNQDGEIPPPAEPKKELRAILESPDGLFDNYSAILSQFKDNIEWRKIEHDRWAPWPKPGLDPEIDKLLEKINKIKFELKEYICNVRKKYATNKIQFAHNHKYVSDTLFNHVEIPIGCASRLGSHLRQR